MGPASFGRAFFFVIAYRVSIWLLLVLPVLWRTKKSLDDRTTRLRRTLQHLSSARFVIAHRPKPALPSIARKTLPRPPHPIPTFVTIMIRPSSRDGMARTCRDDLPDGESGIFFETGLDSKSVICPSGASDGSPDNGRRKMSGRIVSGNIMI